MRFPAPSLARGAISACGFLLLTTLSAQDGYDFTTIGRVGTLSGGTPLLPTLVAPGANGGVHFFLGQRIMKTLAANGNTSTVIDSNRWLGDGPFETAGIGYVSDLITVNGSTLIIVDSGAVRRISLATRTIASIGSIENNTGVELRYGSFSTVARDPAGDLLLVNGNMIERLTLERDGAPLARPLLTLIAGMNVPSDWMDGRRSVARFARPTSVAGDAAGNVFVYDYGNALIRKITPEGDVSTLAGQRGVPGVADGTGTEAQFAQLRPDMPDYLGRMAIDATGNLYVSDSLNHRIRKVTPAGVVTTVGGSDRSGLADGFGAHAAFNRPSHIAVDSDGILYIADQGNGAIRKGTPVWRPTFTTQPVSQAVAPGQTVTLTGAATGTPAPALQWTRNGTAISGATAATLTLPNAQIADSGRYALIATNPAGAVTSNVATITVGGAPLITTQPVAQTISSGGSLTLSVVATGATSVQWLKDGQPISGANGPTLTITAATAADAGNYSVVLTNAAGSTTSAVVTVVVNSSRIVNLSIRSALGTAAPMLTVGFVVRGDGKSLLVRGVGPTLAGFGVESILADPRITVFSGSTTLALNDHWHQAANAEQISATAARVGAFPLQAGSLDAALLSSFNGGAYSAQITGPAGSRGVVLVELYDAGGDPAARLVNVSTRAQVGTGDNVLVAGFVITGTTAQTLLIRAAGPALAGFGIEGTLPDPKLDVIPHGAATPIASNDNWAPSAALTAATTQQGAFPFPAGSNDAALLVTLEPGSYSVQVSGVGGTTGEALVEIYDVR